MLNYLYGNNKKFDPTKDQVLYSGPFWDEKEILAAINCLINGKWLSSGENIHKFEMAFCHRFNQTAAVMVNSGSSANLVMLAALKKYYGWEDGDGIICSAVNFPTTISTIIQNNLLPVFVDINWEDLNINVKWLDAYLNSTIEHYPKALFLSPVLGNPPNIDRIVEICNKYNLKLILDCCDSLGSKWNGKYLSDYAVTSSYSFYAAHHLCCGEGGMVSSSISEIIDLSRSFAWWGRSCFCVGAANLLPRGTCGKRFSSWIPDYDQILDHKYVFTNMGYNLKPLDLQGAIGLVQLEKFDEIDYRRRANALDIRGYVSRIDGVNTIWDKLFVDSYSEICWFGVPIICDNKEIKHKLQQHLESNRIQTRNYFAGNILRQPAYQYLGNHADYPVADQVLERVLFVGCNPSYTQDHLNYIEKVFKKFNV